MMKLRLASPSKSSGLKKSVSLSLLLVSLAGKNRRNFPSRVKCFPTLKKSLTELNRSNGQRNKNPNNKIKYLFTEFLNPEKMR